MNIADIKKGLQELGISISTPGLTGDERYEELKYRLDQAQRKQTNDNIQKHSQINDNDNLDAMNFTLLTIGELRSSLTSLGISTTTPGLSGQERWAALKQRLIEAICIKREEEEEVNDEEEDDPKMHSPFKVETEENTSQTEKFRRPPSAPPIDEDSSPIDIRSSNEDLNEVEEIDSEQFSHLSKIAQSEISELKRQIKRINNKRSLYIASKFSGSNQDQKLRLLSSELNDIEQDCNRIKAMEDRGEKIIKLRVLKTKIELSNTTSLQSNEFTEIKKVMRYLEVAKGEVKEKIKERRQIIREEAENDAEIGVVAEDQLQQKINQAILANSKVSRTRKKIVETKAIDETFDTEGRADSLKGIDGKLISPPAKKATQSVPSSSQKNDEKQKLASFPSSTANLSLDGYEFPTFDSDRKQKEVHPSKDSKVTEVGSKASPSHTDSMDFHSDFLGKDIQISVSGSKDFEDDGARKNGKQKSEKKRNLDYFIDEKTKNSLFTHPSNDQGEPTTVDTTLVESFLSPKDRRSKGVEETESYENLPENKNSRRDLSTAGTFVVNEDEDGDIEEVFRSSRSSMTPGLSSPFKEAVSRLPTLDHSRDDFEEANERVSEKTEILNPTNLKISLPTKTKRELSDLSTQPQSYSSSVPLSLQSSSNDERQQIKQLRKYAKQLEKKDDYQAAEILYQRALELDPTDIMTLQLFAIFLHQKKGELSRAEAFFNRALQLCMPSIQVQLSTPQKRKQMIQQSYQQLFHTNSTTTTQKNGEFSSPPTMKGSSSDGMSLGFKLNEVIYLLIGFANFMLKSKGDIESSYLLLEKAVTLAPNQAIALANYAHFLSEHHHEEDNLLFTDEELSNHLQIRQQHEHEEQQQPYEQKENRPHPPPYPPPKKQKPKNKKGKNDHDNNTPTSPSTQEEQNRFVKIDEMFRNALKSQPGNVLHMMWYGKFLKKNNKLGPAELMYQSAIECSKGNHKLEPTALCNYASFIFKKRKNHQKAEELFLYGLERFPNHKGLRKNFGQLLKIMEDKKRKEEEKELKAKEKKRKVKDQIGEELEEGEQEDGSDEDDGDREDEDNEVESSEEEEEEEEEEESQMKRRHRNRGTIRSPSPSSISFAEKKLAILPSSPDRQHRGSRRAQRIRNSLANQLPDQIDQNNIEMKADYIMKLLKQSSSH